jgi:hypothetical protein
VKYKQTKHRDGYERLRCGHHCEPNLIVKED